MFDQCRGVTSAQLTIEIRLDEQRAFAFVIRAHD
jgi:hypothetical protein